MEELNGSMQHFVPEEAAHCRLRLRNLSSGLDSADNCEPPVTQVVLAVLPAPGVLIRCALESGSHTS